jgi:hypothetical protein
MSAKKGLHQQIPTRNSRSAHWVKGVQLSDVPYTENALAFFQPDILIGYQFVATYIRRFHLEPEKTLMLAILQDAVVCFQDNLGATDKRKRQLFVEAQEWIMEENANYLYSFDSICALLGFSPSYLRQGLMSWKETMLGSQQAARLAS